MNEKIKLYTLFYPNELLREKLSWGNDYIFMTEIQLSVFVSSIHV